MMLPVYYHNARGQTEKEDYNFRVDASEAGYILRAGTFYFGGIKYTIETDFAFTEQSDPIHGSLWTKDPSQPLQLLVIPESMARMNTGLDRQAIFESYGQKIHDVFCLVDHIHEIKSNKVTTGIHLMVNRAIVPGQLPAEQTPPIKASLAQAVTEKDHASFQAVRANMTASAKAASEKKTWAQLSPEEREAAMQSIAENMGLVRPA